jgi:hypothetical protein
MRALMLGLVLLFSLSDEPVQRVSGKMEVLAEGRGGNAVSDLGDTDFEMKRGKTPCSVLSVTRNDEPIAIGILIDTSLSMKDKIRDGRELAETVKAFLELENNHPNNTYFLVQFSTGVDLLVDYTQDRDRILEALPTRWPPAELWDVRLLVSGVPNSFTPT